MITREEATRLAADHLKALGGGSGEEFSLAPDHTIERATYFVFFYNTKRFLQTGEDCYRLAGNGPILVSKQDGYLHAYGTNKPVEVSIADFERRIARAT